MARRVVTPSGSAVVLTVIGLLLVLALGKLALDATDVSAASGETVGASGEDSCAASGLVAVDDTGLCTHGPDEAPPSGDPSADEPTFGAAASDPAITCVGAGSSGSRVQVLYVRPSDVPSRAGAQATIRGVAARADRIFRDGAVETGGSRSIRFVHSAGCVLSVTEVVVPPAARSSFGATIEAVRAKGYGSTTRKYLMFMDASVLCGVGTVVPDDRREAANGNNVGPSYARVDLACWTPDIAAHELMHTLGGVQDSAPNSSLGGHCTDDYDLMCYPDAPYYPAMRVACPDPAGDTQRLDCNHDDYYNTNPPPSSYLATRWNSANNRFLVGAVDQTALSAPANDDLDRAIDAGARGFTDARAIVSSATQAVDDPRASCTPYAQSATVWYTTTPSASGTMTLDTLGSRYRTVLSVWTGTRGNVTEVACDVPTEPNGPSRVEFAATAGTTYSVMVGSYYTPGATELTLTLSAPVNVAGLTLSKDKSKYNGAVAATLSGFAPNASVTLRWPRAYEITSGPDKGLTTTLLASGAADGDGRVTLGFRTPLEPLGDYELTARDAAGAKATATFRVIPRILLNEVAGSGSTKLRVYFYGFAAGDRIEVRWHANGAPTSSFQTIQTVAVAGNGRASSLVTIPRGAARGTHLIVGKVVVASRSASTPFTLTSSSVTGEGLDDDAPTATLTATRTATATPEASPTTEPTTTVTPESSPTVEPDAIIDPEAPAAPDLTATATPESTATVAPATNTPTPAQEPTPLPDASPVADAGDDQTVTDADGSEDEPVSLDGGRSTDPEGQTLTYVWSVDGTEVATGATATVTLPVGSTTVTLTVIDAVGGTSTDEVVVTVETAPA